MLSTPEWETETPDECVYELQMCGSDGQPAQVVEISRDEYIGIKRNLAASRHREKTEIDVKSPLLPSNRRGGLDICLQLKELHPGDPGALSGALLRVSEDRDSCVLSAEFGNHSLGILHGAALCRFSAGAQGQRDIEAHLIELYPKIDDSWFSGVVMKLTGDISVRQLMVISGIHCFGTVGADDLQLFLDCVRDRLRPSPGVKDRKAQRA
jgi:hypothetical protein